VPSEKGLGFHELAKLIKVAFDRLTIFDERSPLLVGELVSLAPDFDCHLQLCSEEFIFLDQILVEQFLDLQSEWVNGGGRVFFHEMTPQY
jgi:hypothetical protein